MEWTAMRALYERLFAEAKKRGETQESVAARGGIRQNQISKMLDNDNLGPQVETFARAVEGLGLTVSSFFAQIEGLKTSATDEHNAPLSGLQGAMRDSSSIPPPPLTEADRDLYRKIARGFMAAAASGERDITEAARVARPPAKRRRRR